MNSIKLALIGARVFARAVVGASLPAFVLSFVTTALPFDAYAAKLVPSASQPTAASSYTIKPVKSRLGRISETDPSLLNRTESTPIRVMVKLDYDAVASYEGNVPGYAATSPKKTGKKLKQNKKAVDAYSKYAAGYEAQVLAQIASRIPAAKIGQSYRVVYGGVAITLPANKISDLLAIPGVVAVQRDNLEQPSTDVTPAFLGATSVWPLIGGPTKAGEGVLVGVLDTGVWPEHQSFADHGLAPPAGAPFPCQFGGSNDAAFACNNKLVGAYAFLNTYLAVFGPSADEFCVTGGGHTCSARDAEGHGTHTASTAAGGPVDHATLLGTDRGHISGIAPGAHVIMYRVCRAQGCFNSDSIAAVNQAITDGVDVINFSIGGGSSAYTDAVELAFFDAYVAGVIVNASAGNSGPGAATADHTGPWVNTVGASSSNRAFISTLHLTASGASLDVNGVTVTAPMPATPVVINTADPFCLNSAPAGTFTGKVVVCQRGGGGLGRVSKGFNVLQRGAAGMILYNPTKQELESDNHWLPAIHIEGPATGTGDAAKVLAFLAAYSDAKAEWTTGVATPITGDVMAAFSSRGPAGDFIKPDVTAPGVSILAGMTPQPDPADVTLGPPLQLFQAIAGTSMSSPHAAGVAALIRAVHPLWTPGQVKSALMTSSVQDTLKEDGLTPADPFDRGAGAIRADRAINPTVTFDVGPLDYLTSATDVIGRVHLNLPSINAPTMPGEITTYRTMHNVSGAPQILAISATAPPGADIIVAKASKGSKTAQSSDPSIVLGKDEDVTLQVTIRAAALPDGQYFGQIVLDPKKKGANAVVLPVAFNKRQGGVTLAQACSPSSFATSGHTTCEVHAENLLSSDATVGIEVDPSKGLNYANVVTTVGSPAATLSGNVIKWNGTLIGTTPPDIFIAPMGAGDSTPNGGYTPLSLFGVTPIAGAGDETIHNFNVPAFSYGGETYSRLGIVSNGYIVIGGGTSNDIDFINQNLPNPTRPNNVIAPFWTDLNPATGGAMRIGILTDGVSSSWIVVDFNAVREFGTTKTTTFEVWIGLNTNPMSEDISIDYGTFTSTGTDGFVTVGAENRTGTRGQNVFVDGANGTGVFPVNGTMLRVTSSPPLPGGAVTFHYDASAKKAGNYTSTANMTSNLTAGTTQDVEVLTVTP